ncbi:MAG: prolyl oligopeptidase family serine peptidase [Chloroflexota bacterium]
MKPQRTPRQRIRFVAVVTLIALLAVAVLIPLLLGASFISLLTAPGCGGETLPPMPYEDISFPSSEFNRPTPAYFIPADQPNSAATIIVIPTGNAGRGDRIGEIEVYHAGGFNVLTYSSRTCLSSVANTLGYAEAAQVGDALAYLATRTDVDSRRIGLHGFSAGGASAIMAAARFPAIRAVVAAGGYHDFRDEVERNTPPTAWFAPFFRFGALLTYRLNIGEDMSVLSPISVIGQIAPRPILLIYGTNEPGLEGARGQQIAGGSNVQLWEVEGATHGSYLITAPDEYRQRVIGFMSTSLEATPGL